MLIRRPNSEAAGTALGIGATVAAVACCAVLPATGVLVGGLTFAAVIGVAAAAVLVATIIASAFLVLRARRRAACRVKTRQGRSWP